MCLLQPQACRRLLTTARFPPCNLHLPSSCPAVSRCVSAQGVLTGLTGCTHACMHGRSTSGAGAEPALSTRPGALLDAVEQRSHHRFGLS